MGNWLHTDSVSLTEYVAASMARGRSAAPWGPRDVSAFRGVELQRALCLGGLTGRVVVLPRTESNPVASMAVDVGPLPTDPARAAAVKVLTTTSAILSGGLVDSSDIQTVSSGTAGDVGVPPLIVAGVVVVALGGLGFLGYCVHQSAQVIDHSRQREADMAKLKQADAQALEIIKRHTDREAQAGKQLSLDDASKSALSALAKMQEVLAAKQSVDPPSKGFFESLSTTEKIVGGLVVVAGAALLLRK